MKKKGPLSPLVQHLRDFCKNLPQTNGQGELYLLPKNKDGNNMTGRVAGKAKEDTGNVVVTKHLQRLVSDNFLDYPL
jgi:hypothetical protein